MDYADLDSFLHKDARGVEVEKGKKVVEALNQFFLPFYVPMNSPWADYQHRVCRFCV